MELYPHITINDRQKLLIEKIEAVKLAKRYGTPLYVYSENAIIDRMREYTQTLKGLYPNGQVAYASKAYLTLRMAQLAAQEGLWLDVASGGELYIALKSGFPAERIIFHGNNKTFEELDMALASGVGRIVIDSLEEIKTVELLAAQRNKIQSVFLRLAPGVDSHTHKFLATGEITSKFGIPMYQDQHFKAARMVNEAPHLLLRGFHCHIGSQIFETAPFITAVKIMLNFVFELKKKTGICVQEVDMGGGLGVAYTAEENEVGIREYLTALTSAFLTESQKLGLADLKLFVEPGRSIVAKAGVTLYRVGAIKKLPNGTIVAAVDGSMSDNPRPMLYGAKYRAVLAAGRRETKMLPVRIVGKACEEGDTLIQEAWLPPLNPGDLLAVLVTGAYHYTMASNYNGLLRPAVVHVSDSRSMLVVKRQRYEDLVAGQKLVMPVHRIENVATVFS